MNTLTIGKNTYSRVVLGTAYFAPENRDTAFAVMDAYYARGGRTIDTARVYGAWGASGAAGIGNSELVIGEWLASRGYSDITLITKGAHPVVGNMLASRLDRESVLSDAAESVKTLGRVPDLWFLHRDDLSRPVSEIAETLKILVDSGYARTVGASNWTFDRIMEYNAYAAANGCPEFQASQIQWSLAVTTPEAYGDPTLICMNDAEYVKYLTHQFPVFAFSSQAKGFFSKAIAGGIDSLPEKARHRFATPENLRRLEQVRANSEAHSITPAQYALDYLTKNPVPACAIAAFSSVAQLEDSIVG